MKYVAIISLASALIFLSGCNNSTEKKAEESTTANKEIAADATSKPAVNKIVIECTPDAQKVAQEALILAQPGDVIEFAEGKFEFDGTLSIDGVQGVTVRGQGIEKTILNFSGIKTGKGAEGVKVKADNFVLEDLTLEDSPGDAIKLQDCHGLTLRRIKTWWTGGPNTENGAYGLYPVLSEDVLIEDCIAEGASDAGIYVGQSTRVIVRNCTAEQNVAGIEIENCVQADVYNNVARNNTGGILVFSLPGLTLKNGNQCRVFDNQILENNHDNFAKKGAIVSTVPPGTGLMIMANDQVEVFKNKFDKNEGAQCLIASFLIAQRKYDDDAYDPYPEAISIHDNVFSNGGTKARGEHLQMFTEATKQRLPDIVFDGLINLEKFTDGVLKGESGLSILNNGQASFVNLDLASVIAGKSPDINMDTSVYSAKLPKVKAVELKTPTAQ